MASRLTKLEISYYDPAASPDTVVCGIREFILAERKFGEGKIEAGNMDALGYAAFLAAQRSGLAGEGVSYDAWLDRVAMIESAGDSGESPAPPG